MIDWLIEDGIERDRSGAQATADKSKIAKLIKHTVHIERVDRRASTVQSRNPLEVSAHNEPNIWDEPNRFFKLLKLVEAKIPDGRPLTMYYSLNEQLISEYCLLLKRVEQLTFKGLLKRKWLANV